MDTKAILDHQYTVTAYCITWGVHLGFVLYLGLKWRAQKRSAGRS